MHTQQLSTTSIEKKIMKDKEEMLMEDNISRVNKDLLISVSKTQNCEDKTKVHKKLTLGHFVI